MAGIVPILSRRKAVTGDTCQAFVTCGPPPAASPLVLVGDQMSVLKGSGCLGKLGLGYMEEGEAAALSELVLLTYLRGGSRSVTCAAHTGWFP